MAGVTAVAQQSEDRTMHGVSSSDASERSIGLAAALKRVTAGQERRRGLNSFLTWPFLLGMAFAGDAVTGSTHAAAAADNAPPPHPSDDAQAPHADTSLDPVTLSDWEPGGPQQTSQELLPEPHFPEAITLGGVDTPAVTPAVESTPMPAASIGGGGAISAQGDGMELSAAHLAPSDALMSLNGLGSDGLLDLRVGSEPLGSLLSNVGNTVSGLTGQLDSLPVVDGLITDVGHLVGALLGSSEEPSAVGMHLSGVVTSGSVVASGGTIAFGAAPPGSSMPQLFINGSYTDFGVAVQTSGTDNHGSLLVTGHLDPSIAPVDLEHPLDHLNHQDPGGAVLVPLIDDTQLRTPLDLLGLL
jgi:hypothetical protein